MTSIQMVGWPIVTVSFNRPASDEDAGQWLNNLSELLGREQSFSLIIQAKPNSEFSPEARRQLGLWFKENRDLLGEHCCGVARVVLSEEEGERVVSDNMKKAMPFPMISCLDFNKAREWAIEQFNQTTV
ncbi:hypothetical protein [Endozoicomonas arenosclerae]|uniref:hypothetical protein n=1 Tax=Endozoicomonas arenosclerae TaxID=1633495 RepID=UPI000AD83D87|nr:hypothetical protein [Endozoicomonas arenosclerae]